MAAHVGFALISWLSLSVAATGQPSPVHRFALLIGANRGGSNLTPLRYATSDAQALGRVLVELGGVEPEDETVLLDPSGADVLTHLQKLRGQLERARRQHERTELLVYFSGHSDETGLRLMDERLPYPDLRRELQELPADVRIAILDSCASGAMTRRKGGARRAPFLQDMGTVVKGHAILTSSSNVESSQESERLQGSFFTHYLISGLRGAADTSHDGRVTLSEAYHYAYEETLARTEATQEGAQHPGYEMDLVGSGDLVLTDLHRPTASVTLAPPLRGHFFVHDVHGRVLAELNKIDDRSAEVALEPGRYRVVKDQDGELSQERLTLLEGERTELTFERAEPVDRELTASRGDLERVLMKPKPEWRLTATAIEGGSWDLLSVGSAYAGEATATVYRGQNFLSLALTLYQRGNVPLSTSVRAGHQYPVGPFLFEFGVGTKLYLGNRSEPVYATASTFLGPQVAVGAAIPLVAGLEGYVQMDISGLLGLDGPGMGLLYCAYGGIRYTFPLWL